MRVSVIIPVYNAAAFVRNAVESVLNQPETGEVLLIEDGSSDNSLAVCRQLAEEHPRVRLLRHPDGKNHGAGATRNVGLRNVRHEYVAFLDADDFCLPNRFRMTRQIFEAHPDADGVYEAMGTVFEDDSAKDWWHSCNKPHVYMTNVTVAPDRLFEFLVKGGQGTFCTGGLTVRRHIFERTGEFDSRLRMCQDTAMWIKMAAVGCLVGGSHSKLVGMRRVHGDNRIFQHRDQHPDYKIQMGQSLIRWGKANRLPRMRMILLLDHQIKSRLYRIPTKHGWLRLEWNARCLFVLIHILLRYPLVLRSRYYFASVARLCGWRRIKRLLRAVFAGVGSL